MSSFEALRADVVWQANTGQVEADIEKLRREATHAFGQMSDSSLRLAVAQEKYDRVLAKHGPTSRQAAQAELVYRREVEQTTAATTRHAAALDRQEHELSQATRGAIAGSGAFRGLGRSVAFASATFLGGAGLVYGIRATLDAAKESQRVLGQTENAVKHAGLSWEKYGEDIQRAALEQANLSGFDDERLLGTFTSFLRRTKDVNEALRLNALAANVARGANLGLEQASKIVLRASIGQARGLANIGVAAQKGASGVELLDLLERKFAGSAEAYGHTAEGAQDRFNVALQNTEEIIGTALLPQVTHYLDSGADWLSQTRNQERIQRDVNAAVHDGAAIIHGFADAVDAVDGPIEAVVGALGGLEKAAELALISGIVLKARKAALGFGLIQAASVKTRNVIVENAAAEEAALNGVTAAEARTAAGAAVPAGGVGKRGIPGGGTLGTIAAILGITYGPSVAKALLGSENASNSAIKATVAGAGGFAKGSPDERAYLAMIHLQFHGYDLVEDGRSIPTPAAGGGFVAFPSQDFRPTGENALTRAQRAQYAVQTAQGTPGTADDLSALRQQRTVASDTAAWLKGQLAGARGKRAKEIFGELQNALSQEQQASEQIQQIFDADARKKEEAARKAEAAKKAAEAAEKKRRDAIIDRLQVYLESVGKLGVDVKKAQAQEAAAAKKAHDQAEAAAKAAAERISAQRSIQEQLLSNALAEAHLDETNAGDNQGKIDKARDHEAAIIGAQIKLYEQRARDHAHLTVAAQLDARASAIAARQQLADLRAQRQDKESTARAEAAAFNDYRLSFLGQFGGDVFHRGPAGLEPGGAPIGRSPVHDLVRQGRETNDHLAKIAARPVHLGMRDVALAAEGLFGG